MFQPWNPFSYYILSSIQLGMGFCQAIWGTPNICILNPNSLFTFKFLFKQKNVKFGKREMLNTGPFRLKHSSIFLFVTFFFFLVWNQRPEYSMNLQKFLGAPKIAGPGPYGPNGPPLLGEYRYCWISPDIVEYSLILKLLSVANYWQSFR